MSYRLFITATKIEPAEGKGLFDKGKREYRLVWCWSDRGPNVMPPETAEAKAGFFSKGEDGDMRDHGSGVVCGQSTTFYGTNAEFPVNIEGGIPIFGPRDPEGQIAAYVALYEIDKNYTMLGAHVEEARKTSAITQVVDFIARGPYGPLVSVIDALPAMLKQAGNPDLHAAGVFDAIELDTYGFKKQENGLFAPRTWQIRGEKATVTCEGKLFWVDDMELEDAA